MWTRTKIICTIGPSVDSYENILALIDAGMNVARLNFSHGTHEEHEEMIARLKKARAERGVSLAIMLDTKGPEIRVGKVAGEGIFLAAGQEVLLVREEVEGSVERLSIHPAIALDGVEEGAKILFDDGYITSRVIRREKGGVRVQIENPGVIKTNKGVNIPGVAIALPALTEQDVRDIEFGCAHDVDVIAASFIRSAEHVHEIKALLKRNNKMETWVLAKIENSLGVVNFDEILQAADGIMVARGDLGVELPLREVPRLQKMMIRKSYQAGKPAVIATQMLESMIKNPRPTRAEVSDVANAIYDSAAAVMLSGETAVGAYPVETVKMMKSIIEESEGDFDYHAFFHQDYQSEQLDVSMSVALASVKLAYSTKARAIFVFTSGGVTPRLVSRFRPKMPIVAFSSHPKRFHQMAMNWGVIPADPAMASSTQEAFGIVRKFCLEHGLISPGDRVIVTAGAPFGVSGTTNMILVERV